MGIKDKVAKAINDISASLAKDEYGPQDYADAVWNAPIGPVDGTVDVNHVYNDTSTTDHTITIGDNTSGTSTGAIWVDSTGKDIYVGDPQGDYWTTTIGGTNSTLTLGNVEIVVTEAGEVKISVTDGDDVTDYFFSKDKTKKFLEQFADVTVTRKL